VDSSTKLRLPGLLCCDGIVETNLVLFGSRRVHRRELAIVLRIGEEVGSQVEMDNPHKPVELVRDVVDEVIFVGAEVDEAREVAELRRDGATAGKT
jgi:hypothetical protein